MLSNLVSWTYLGAVALGLLAIGLVEARPSGRRDHSVLSAIGVAVYAAIFAVTVLFIIAFVWFMSVLAHAAG